VQGDAVPTCGDRRPSGEKVAGLAERGTVVVMDDEFEDDCHSVPLEMY
jgi:hypothetical protein